MIDAVITWVDGADPKHQASLENTLKQLGIRKPDTAQPTRFDDSGELEYCVTSLLKFAPWLNRIYIVTDQQVPPLLNKLAGTLFQSRIKVIDHRELFSGYPAHLPTFNIRSIVAMLWNIPDLAEQFIFLNDDFVITAPVEPEEFFQNGKPVIRGRRRFFTKTGPCAKAKAFFKSNRSRTARPSHNLGQELSARLAGMRYRYLNLPHYPHPMQKSVMRSFYQQHPDALNTNIGYPFRQANQHVPEVLAAYLAIQQKQGIIKNSAGGAIIKAKAIKPERLNRVLNTFQGDDYFFLCIQDLGEASEDNFKQIKDWLDNRIGQIEDMLE